MKKNYANFLIGFLILAESTHLIEKIIPAGIRTQLHHALCGHSTIPPDWGPRELIGGTVASSGLSFSKKDLVNPMLQTIFAITSNQLLGRKKIGSELWTMTQP